MEVPPISSDKRYFVHRLLDYDPNNASELTSPELAQKLRKLAFHYIEAIETNYPPDQPQYAPLLQLFECVSSSTINN
jgi:hypothetical protein